MAFVDLGNCVNFKITHSSQKKEHFKTRGGTRTKNRTDNTQAGASGSFILDEVIGASISKLAMATVIENTDGSVSLKGLSKRTFTGTLKVEQDNSRGPKITWTGRVSFTPGGEMTLIADNDEYTQIPINFDVEEDEDGSYGAWRIEGGAAAPDAENYQIPTGIVSFEEDAEDA
jgi:hypothetical protein